MSKYLKALLKSSEAIYVAVRVPLPMKQRMSLLDLIKQSIHINMTLKSCGIEKKPLIKPILQDMK